jgi:hypothetical protein
MNTLKNWPIFNKPPKKLKQSSFIGSFEAEADFAENSENILHSLLSEKNYHR